MSYDDLDRLVGVTAGSAQGGNAVFAYDVLDNIRQLDQGTRTVRHTYNTSNRISAIKDAAGNTLSTYVQDTRGNLVQRTTGTVIDTFTFDKANRLKATTINGVSSVYGYDGLGRRMQQAEAGVSSYFVYGQAGQLLFSQDGVNRYNHIHLAGSLVAKRLVPFSGTTSIRYQHTDALGSPVAETSEAGVLYLPRERMTAYGEPADGTWQAGPGFTGHQMDASSKLVYMQQRYYDPVSGRFLSEDPMASDAQNGWNFNRYNYAANNPYRFRDPDGRRVTGLSCGMVCNRQRVIAGQEAMERERIRREMERSRKNENWVEKKNDQVVGTIGGGAGAILSGGEIASTRAAASLAVYSGSTEAAEYASEFRGLAGGLRLTGTGLTGFMGGLEIYNGLSAGDPYDVAHGTSSLGVLTLTLGNVITPGAGLAASLIDLAAQQVHYTEEGGARVYGWRAIGKHYLDSGPYYEAAYEGGHRPGH